MNKEYKTVDEMIDYLRENKRIIVSDEYRKVFEERSYISLINPYKEFFSYGRNEKGEHIYPVETDFEKIMSLIKIDDDFSRLMYLYIGIFEKKFKNLLFEEICLKYVVNDDKDCLGYVDEIKDFLLTLDYNLLPKFCPNFRYTISKKHGYVVDEYQVDSRLNVLKHIEEIATGFKDDGTTADISNRLINHYLKTQSYTPLWAIPNALTLGELNSLYAMLDSDGQKRIIMKVFGFNDFIKIDYKKIISFCGQLEMIRRMRNIVNHYEPIFPLLFSELKPIKKIHNSQIVSVMELLEYTYSESILCNSRLDNVEIEKNVFNSKYLKILDYICNMISTNK